MDNMLQFGLNLDARRFDNSVDVYIDGKLQPMRHGEALHVNTVLSPGEHTIKIERSSILTGRAWLLKVFLHTFIGYFGSIPPEFEKGNLYNAVFEATFCLQADTTVNMGLTNAEDGAYTYDFENFEVTNNKSWHDKKLEKRRRWGRVAFVVFVLAIFAAIVAICAIFE